MQPKCGIYILRQESYVLFFSFEEANKKEKEEENKLVLHID